MDFDFEGSLTHSSKRGQKFLTQNESQRYAKGG
jgi:hypothetical protein